ncbi:MAG: glycosyltransferase family 9 protein, partial [Planctomycetota bacterium]
ETKVWPPERFAETIDALHSRSDVRCVLLGGPDDVSLCERIARACRSEPISLAGRTDVRQLAAVVGLADVVLCHDSAAMHLAVALRRPLVCLIGPTNPRRTGPYGRPGDVVSLELDCAPCYLRRLSQCPHNHRCMRELGSDKVVSALERLATRMSLAET